MAEYMCVCHTHMNEDDFQHYSVHRTGHSDYVIVGTRATLVPASLLMERLMAGREFHDGTRTVIVQRAELSESDVPLECVRNAMDIFAHVSRPLRHYCISEGTVVTYMIGRTKSEPYAMFAGPRDRGSSV